MIDRLEIFDAFCHWFDDVVRGYCLRILSNIRLMNIINDIGECSGIADSGVDDRYILWDIVFLRLRGEGRGNISEEVISGDGPADS